MTTGGQDTPAKKLRVLKPGRRADDSYTHAWREVKVLWPTCKTCQEQNLPGWYRTCEHNPYVSSVREDVITPLIKCENGHEVVEGELACSVCGSAEYVQEGEVIKPRFMTQPKTRGVRVDETANSGRSLDVARSKGAILPTQMGVAAMCEFSRCYNPVMDENGQWLKTAVRTQWGIYCSEREAKLVRLVLGAESIEIFNVGKQAEQLQGISL